MKPSAEQPHQPEEGSTSEKSYPGRRLVFLGAGALIGALIVLNGKLQEDPYPRPHPTPEAEERDPFESSIDLLKKSGRKDWAMPGAEFHTTSGTLTVDHLKREIVEQDGTEPQRNNPINLASHLEFDPDLGTEITLTLKDIKNSASVQFYSRPPAIYDEKRFEQGSIRLTLEEGTLYYDQWDGSSNTPKTGEIEVDTKTPTLTLRTGKGQVSILANGKEAFTLPDIFTNGNIWFGADSENKGGSFTITKLEAIGKVRNVRFLKQKTYNTDVNGLQFGANLHAREQFKLGAAISLGPLAEALPGEQYRKLAEEQFGSWTTENALKFQFAHPQPEVYCFEEADLIIGRAEECVIDVHGHALDFGSSPPPWLQKVARNHPEKLQSILEAHIAKVVGRYEGRIKTWDVINEPLADYDDTANGEGAELRNHVWHQGMGADHLAIALRAAHKADKEAQLFINEYGLERDSKRWDFFLQTIDTLQAKGVPLHGVGFQAHVYEKGRDDIDPEVLRKHMRQLAERGLKVRISEIDVCERDTAYQAGQYAGVLKVALEEPNVINYTTWGVTEAYGSTSWIDNNNKGRRHIGDGLLFDAKGRPLKAYDALKRVIQSAKPRG